MSNLPTSQTTPGAATRVMFRVGVDEWPHPDSGVWITPGADGDVHIAFVIGANTVRGSFTAAAAHAMADKVAGVGGPFGVQLAAGLYAAARAAARGGEQL